MWGINSLSRVTECAGMRASTSWNQANGSTPHRLQVAMKVRSTAAVLPPLSLPKNVQLPAANRHHASILPMSGRKLMSTTVGTPFTVDVCGCSTANNVRAAGLFMSRCRPAQ